MTTATTHLVRPQTEEPRRGRWRVLLADRRGLIATLVLAALLLFAVIGPLTHDPIAQDAPRRLLSPSLDQPFGTDELRRDTLARTAVGLRTSIALSLGAVSVGALVGAVAGMTAGYAGGWVDSLIMRVIDAWLAFPGLLAAIAVLTIVGPGATGVGIALALFIVPSFTRIARAQTLAERPKEYIEAAIAIGATPVRVVSRHIAVNAAPALLTQFALALTAAIRIEAGLSFLGLGSRPPAPSLGGMISSAQPFLRETPCTSSFPRWCSACCCSP